MNKLVYLVVFCSCFISCKKEAGSGGTSSITGNISGKKYARNKSAEKEVTNIIVPNGKNINDGEYILINTPENGTYYYIWFKWDNGVEPDPGLTGRTGIKVIYNFTQSNITVAANMLTALKAIASDDFEITQTNDILTLTNINYGDVPDADEQTSNVTVDIANQGKNAVGGSTSYIEGPMVDERVYLIFGDESFYSESVRTDENGNYQFKDLNRGKYHVYAFSFDELNPNNETKIQVGVDVEITKKKEIVNASDIIIITN